MIGIFETTQYATPNVRQAVRSRVRVDTREFRYSRILAPRPPVPDRARARGSNYAVRDRSRLVFIRSGSTLTDGRESTRMNAHGNRGTLGDRERTSQSHVAFNTAASTVW